MADVLGVWTVQQIPWTANHGSEQPCRIVVYDTETLRRPIIGRTDVYSHSLRLGVAHLWQRKRLTWAKTAAWRFVTTEQFWEFLYKCMRPREPLWVYAHNASFDAAIVKLWGEIDAGRLLLASPGRDYTDKKTGELRRAKEWHGRLAVDNLPFIVECRNPGGTAKFVDTMNYLPVGLPKIAKWVGMEKTELPTDADGIEKWWARCQRDVEITEQCVLKLLALWNGRRLGTWQMTMPGLAYSCFRHIVPNSGIVCHGDKPATAEELFPYWLNRTEAPLDALELSRLERRSYYGARTLTAFIGDIVPQSWMPPDDQLFVKATARNVQSGPVTCFDVNGLYAYVMLTKEFPVESMHSIIDPDITLADNLAHRHPCIADVRLSARSAAYPSRAEGRTAFCRGTYPTTLAGPELVAAFDRGHVRNVSKIAVYHSGRPFVEYVRYWWNYRLDALAKYDELSAKLAKGMYTGLFGKLGQRRPEWQLATDLACPKQWGPFLNSNDLSQGFERCRAVGGVAQRIGERIDCRHTFTAIASFVTSYGRVFMDEIRAALPDKSVIYQDTDSLFLLPAGGDALRRSGLVHPTELGKFKEEGEYNFVSIYGPKNYRRNGVDTVAGLRTIRTEVGERVWRQAIFERCKSIIKGQPNGTVEEWQSVFAPTFSQDSLTVQEDGWTIPTVIYR